MQWPQSLVQCLAHGICLTRIHTHEQQGRAAAVQTRSPVSPLKPRFSRLQTGRHGRTKEACCGARGGLRQETNSDFPPNLFHLCPAWLSQVPLHPARCAGLGALLASLLSHPGSQWLSSGNTPRLSPLLATCATLFPGQTAIISYRGYCHRLLPPHPQ